MQTYALNVVGCERRSIHIVCAVTIVSFSQTALSNAKPLSTCNYTSNNGRSIRGLEILPAAHARTHTHKHTALSEMHRSLVSAEVCMWLDPSHRQAKDNEKNSGVDGSLTSCGDAQKESENKAFIQVFHPIQSVKSTNAVMLRHTHMRQDQARQRWRS